MTGGGVARIMEVPSRGGPQGGQQAFGPELAHSTDELEDQTVLQGMIVVFHGLQHRQVFELVRRASEIWAKLADPLEDHAETTALRDVCRQAPPPETRQQKTSTCT